MLPVTIGYVPNDAIIEANLAEDRWIILIQHLLHGHKHCNKTNIKARGNGKLLLQTTDGSWPTKLKKINNI